MNKTMFAQTILIFCFCFAASASPLHAEPQATYALKTVSSGNRTGFDILRLYNTKTQQTVWTRKFKHDYARVIAWSEDTHALAIYLRWNKILIWRLGYRTRFYDAPREEDYIMGFLWSPDKRRLLIHAGHSGADMTPTSHLFCLNVVTKRMSSIAKGALRVGPGKASWIGPRVVRYRYGDYDNKRNKWIFQGKPKIWRSP